MLAAGCRPPAGAARCEELTRSSGAHEEALVATSLPCSGRGCVGWLDLGEMRGAGRLQ